MFGFGGGELVFTLFIILMLFGSEKIPEIARTMGKFIAQMKNATNDIKNEIQKGAEANGFDTKSLSNFTQNITAEFTETKDAITGNFSNFSKDILESTTNISQETNSEVSKIAESIEDSLGAIKRKK